ncbi:MAG: HEPN domain-containing protein [Bacteroidia bacterium]|nr:HEPN domain-containing protein [Bacteroidia bacterium]
MTKEEHILYWVEQADDSWETAVTLINSKHYMMALFCWHLTIKKLLKALWIKNNNDNYPPRTHNLKYLHDEAKLSLSTEWQTELLIVNSWNIEGRYPDYQTKLYKLITKEYIDTKTQTILNIKICLQEMLQ